MAVLTERAAAREQTSRGGVWGVVFVVVVILQNALRAGAPANDASPATIAHYFRTHRALELLIAIALLGLALAAVHAGIVGTAFRTVAAVGAALLALTAALVPAIAQNRSPAMAIAAAGFLCWLAFVGASAWQLGPHMKETIR